MGKLTPLKLPEKQPPKRRIQGFFIRGPIPGEWLVECLKLGLSATKIGLALLYLRHVTKSDTVKLTTATRALFLISPWHVSRQLAPMIERGLVAVEESRRGVAPVITLLLDRYYEPVE